MTMRKRTLKPGEPRYRIQFNGEFWFVEPWFDKGYGYGSEYHETEKGARLQLEIIECEDHDEKIRLMVRRMGMTQEEFEALP